MPNISTEAKNEALDAMLANVNGGFLRLYTGSGPADPTDPATGTLLAEIALGNPAFSAASGGSATLAASTAEDAAPASGTVGYARMTKSDSTGVMQLAVGGSVRVTASDSAGDLLLTSTAAHGLNNDDPVRFFVESGGVLPSNITAGTTYYASAVGATTFKLALTAGGLAIAYVDAGTSPFRATMAANEVALATNDGSVTAGVSVAVASLVVSIS